MIGFDATDLQVAMLRVMARKLRAAAPLAGDEATDSFIDQVSRASIESCQDWRDHKSNRSRYADL